MGVITERVATEFGTKSRVAILPMLVGTASHVRCLSRSMRNLSRNEMSSFGFGIAQSARLKQTHEEFSDRCFVLGARSDEWLGKEGIERPTLAVGNFRGSPRPCLKDLLLRRRYIEEIPSQRPTILVVLCDAHQDPFAVVVFDDLVNSEGPSLPILCRGCSGGRVVQRVHHVNCPLLQPGLYCSPPSRSVQLGRAGSIPTDDGDTDRARRGDRRR